MYVATFDEVEKKIVFQKFHIPLILSLNSNQ